MAITVVNFLKHLESLHGCEFKTVYGQKPFILLFHDMTKLRIRLPDRDLSVPISVLLFGIIQLLTRKEFSRDICAEILGRDWGFPFVARLLLECDDVCIKADESKLVLSRIKLKAEHPLPVKPPEPCTTAVNPGNGNGRAKFAQFSLEPGTDT
jgi:hypothetical protein